ncbi:hypothetical protein [Nocardioides sp. SR21]|uniref:hypothetical protein n=1 Tax=Nocardioides sp. SR21 TaxID=2919501 RepID=UPI001FAB31CB|nr:hypothetical protein [Nocardioides sp. SR21]
MWKPWTWSRGSNERAIGNARASATELNRRRVERQEVELYLAQRPAQRTAQGPAQRPVQRPVVAPVRRPA